MIIDNYQLVTFCILLFKGMNKLTFFLYLQKILIEKFTLTYLVDASFWLKDFLFSFNRGARTQTENTPPPPFNFQRKSRPPKTILSFIFQRIQIKNGLL